MGTDTNKKHSGFAMPAVIKVPTSWAEEMVVKGKLTLTPAQFDLLTGSDEIEIPADSFNAVTDPTKSNQTREWIEPLDAVHWLSSKLGSDRAAKSAIADRLRDGSIGCCHVWMSKGPDIGPFSNKRPKFPVRGTGSSFPPWVSPVQRGKGLAMLGGVFWSYSDDWDADLNRWDWRSGVFVASREEMTVVTVDGIPTRQMQSGLRTRMVVSGIRFRKADLDKIIVTHNSDNVASPAAHQEIGSNGSASDAWPEWVAELVLLEHEGFINAKTKVSEICKMVADRLQERGLMSPSRTRVYPAASATIKALRERGRLA